MPQFVAEERNVARYGFVESALAYVQIIVPRYAGHPGRSHPERCGVHYSKVVHNVRCSPPAEKLLPARTKLLCLRHSPARCRRWRRSSLIAAAAAVAAARSEARRVGKECVSTGRTRWES